MKTKTTTELYLTLERLAKEQPDLWELKREVVRHALGAAKLYERLKAEFHDVAGFCQRNLSEAQERLDADVRPNSLGVLQATGVRVDLLCARLADAHQRLMDSMALMDEFAIHGDAIV